MDNKKYLPNFLVIGPPKCATSWLYFCLREHPDIYLPFIKEVHFFDKFYDQGLEFYQRYFKARKNQKACGEITPNYILDDTVAQRIASDLPDVRLVACFRNPIDRAYSHYKHEFRRGKVHKDFETALSQEPQYIERGFYNKQLLRYTRLFPREKILILIYEDIRKDPAAFLKQIFSFLEVNENFTAPFFGKKVEAELVAMPAYQRFSKFSSFLRNRLRLGWAIDKAKQTDLLLVVDRFFRRFGYEVDQAPADSNRIPYPMSESTRERLRGIYADENHRLGLALGRDLSFWK